jgi:ABC-type Zn uptake system ZnuABC Zn-binding protein ZnuA
MTIEDIELELSKKLVEFLEEKTGKNPILEGNWIDVKNFVEDVITPSYQSIENSETKELEEVIEELEDKKDELSESIADLSEKAFASTWGAAEFLEKEILPRIEGKWEDYTGDDVKALKNKIRELRIDADDFHTWSWL